MGDMTTPRSPTYEKFSSITLPLATGEIGVEGTGACIDIVAGDCKKMQSGNANLLRVGLFKQTTDATAALTQALVELDHEVVAQWFDNATGGAAVTTLFADCYMLDNHTVTSTSGGNSKAGRVWRLDPILGVLVETYTL